MIHRRTWQPAREGASGCSSRQGPPTSARACKGIPNAAETLLNAADAIASGEGIRAPVTTALRGVRHAYQARYGGDLDVVTVTADLVTFDWQQGRFHPLARVRIANVPLSDADLGY